MEPGHLFADLPRWVSARKLQSLDPPPLEYLQFLGGIRALQNFEDSKMRDQVTLCSATPTFSVLAVAALAFVLAEGP